MYNAAQCRLPADVLNPRLWGARRRRDAVRTDCGLPATTRGSHRAPWHQLGAHRRRVGVPDAVDAAAWWRARRDARRGGDGAVGYGSGRVRVPRGDGSGQGCKHGRDEGEHAPSGPAGHNPAHPCRAAVRRSFAVGGQRYRVRRSDRQAHGTRRRHLQPLGSEGPVHPHIGRQPAGQYLTSALQTGNQEVGDRADGRLWVCSDARRGPLGVAHVCL